MAVSGYTFAQFHLNAQRGLISDLADPATMVKCALLADSYTPQQNVHDCWSAAVWQGSASYNIGDYVIPTTANGHIYVCTAGGTSDSSEPSWPTTQGETVTDGGVTWECIENGDLEYHEVSGSNYTAGGQEITNKSLTQSGGDTVFDGDNLVWLGANLTARWGVIYDDTPVNKEDKKIIAYINFGANKTSTDANFEIAWDSEGIFKTTPNQTS